MMLQFLRDLYRRHRKKLLITTGVAAVSYMIGIYVRNKVREFQEQLKEENATRDLIKKRFSQTQKDCYMTFLSFLPVLVEPIYKELDVEEITKELKLSRKNKSLVPDGKSELNSEDLSSSKNENAGNGEESIDQKLGDQVLSGAITGETKLSKTKVELWQELKVKSLTRFLTLIYSETLLIILLHLQLNIISRKSYLKTALKLASKNQGIRLVDLESEESKNTVDKDLPEQAFLSFTWWLLNKGWAKLRNIVNESVESVFNEISLREEISIEEFGNLMFEVQKNIDSRLFEERSSYELYDNLQEDNAPGTSGDARTLTLISMMLPSQSDEFKLLQETNTVEFLTNFNSNISNVKMLQRMNEELKGYLKSEQVHEISRTISTIGISTIIQNVDRSLHVKQESKNGGPTAASGNDPEKQEQEPQPAPTTRWKLAFILAVLSPQTHELANRRIDNPVLYTMNNVNELDDLSASVYSNFDI